MTYCGVLHGSESGVNPSPTTREARSVPGRDALALIAAIDWTPILVAIITLAGTVFVALLNLYVVRQIRTPSGRSIGAQVEDAHHVGLANHYRIRALAQALGEPGEPDDPETRKRESPNVE